MTTGQRAALLAFTMTVFCLAGTLLALRFP